MTHKCLSLLYVAVAAADVHVRITGNAVGDAPATVTLTASSPTSSSAATTTVDMPTDSRQHYITIPHATLTESDVKYLTVQAHQAVDIESVEMHHPARDYVTWRSNGSIALHGLVSARVWEGPLPIRVRVRTPPVPRPGHTTTFEVKYFTASDQSTSQCTPVEIVSEADGESTLVDATSDCHFYSGDLHHVTIATTGFTSRTGYRVVTLSVYDETLNKFRSWYPTGEVYLSSEYTTQGFFNSRFTR